MEALFDSRQLAITWMSIRMSTIKLNTDCICLGHLASNARSLQENSQSERACYCSHIIKRYNEGLRDWQNVIPITRFPYIDVLFIYLSITGVKKIVRYSEDIRISNLSLFQAKCNVGLVYELINEIKQASSLARSHGHQQAALSFKEFAQMLSENVQVLDQYPECTLQQSANFPDSSAPAKAAQVNNVVFLRIHSITLCSPCIRKFKTVGFRIPGTRSPISCHWNLGSGFWIPMFSGIPDFLN